LAVGPRAWKADPDRGDRPLAGGPIQRNAGEDGEELLPTEHENVLAVENHRLNAAAFQNDFAVLKRLVLVRDRDGAVAQLRAMATRY